MTTHGRRSIDSLKPIITQQESFAQNIAWHKITGYTALQTAINSVYWSLYVKAFKEKKLYVEFHFTVKYETLWDIIQVTA